MVFLIFSGIALAYLSAFALLCVLPDDIMPTETVRILWNVALGIAMLRWGFDIALAIVGG